MPPASRTFFPQLCTLCGAESKRPLALCIGCQTDLPWIESSCKTCGLPLSPEALQLQCGECLTQAAPFTRAITPLFYRKPVSRLITGFKHRHALAHGQLLAQLLADEIRDEYIENRLPEVILPVPLHWQRFLWRGYNQSAELGKQLADRLEIPCHTHLLKRICQTPSQQGLSREQRLQNLKGAFALKQPLAYRRIALLDDVVTTGSTATEIGKLLMQHGAMEIHLWAIARTPTDKNTT